MLLDMPERSELFDSTIGSSEIAATFEQALTAAERLGRPKREINDLRLWLLSLSVAGELAGFARAAPEWLEQVKLDSGYRAWEEHAHIVEPGERLSTAMQLAYGNYFATPEADRVYRPDEAIAALVRYVAMSIAVASNRVDNVLVESLPELLEPFAPINDRAYRLAERAGDAELMGRVRPSARAALGRSTNGWAP
jgi:hypothetical protein